jgi:hypothetical protein
VQIFGHFLEILPKEINFSKKWMEAEHDMYPPFIENFGGLIKGSNKMV